MTSLLRSVLAVALLLVSSSALASETWGHGRRILRQCDYAFDYMAEAALSYRNYTLPWGTSVQLVYGWGGAYWSQMDPTNIPIEWANTQTVNAPASAPYTWSATVSSVVSERNEFWYYNQVQFVWKVTLPNGNVFYEKGNGSTWGYYSANVSGIQQSPCVNDSVFIGPSTPLPITSVEKW
ncbi:hypothetical protein ACLESD_05940 [Pyxidicoccus sp. 3LFB2]